MKFKFLTPVFCFLLLFPPLFLCSQITLRVIVFAATDDSYIGKGNRRSVAMLEEEFKRIKNETNGLIDLQADWYVGKDFSFSKFMEVVEGLKYWNVSNDIVLFYFMGHGFIDEEHTSPNLLFYTTTGPVNDGIVANHHLNLKEVHEKIKSAGARLTITIGEACNTTIEQIKDARLIDTLNQTNVSPPRILKPLRYAELFQIPAGEIMIQSSLRGQYSYVSDLYGGIFTQAFVEALHQVVTSPNPARWKELIAFTKQNAVNLSKKAKLAEKQLPVAGILQLNEGKLIETEYDEPENIIVEAVEQFRGSKHLKKEVRNMMKGRTSSGRVYGLLQQPDIAEINTKYQPLSHYILLGHMGETHDEKGQVLLFYSIARLLYKPLSGPPRISEIDDKVIQKMNRFAERKQRKSKIAKEIASAGSVFHWLIGKQKDYVEILQDQLTGKENEIQDLYDFIAEINQEIVQEEKEIEAINQKAALFQDSIKANRDTIRALDTYKKARVTASIHNVNAATENDFVQIGPYINCLQKNGSPEPCKASIPAIVQAARATINFELDNASNTGKLPLELKGASIGAYCDPKIVEATQNMVDVLTGALSNVPKKNKYMDKIAISGVIKGSADYRGAGKLLSIVFKASQDITETYTDKYGNIKTARFLESVGVRITNEQLAFLRAYCAYDLIKTKVSDLTNNMIDLGNDRKFNIEFEAIEQSVNDKQNADDFRGVDIKINIENLYNYVEEAIQTYMEENDRLMKEIKQYELTKESHELKIKGLEQERKKVLADIDVKRMEISQIQTTINKHGLYGSVTKDKIEDMNKY